MVKRLARQYEASIFAILLKRKGKAPIGPDILMLWKKKASLLRRFAKTTFEIFHSSQTTILKLFT